jgi:ribosomal protein L11 methyltransferase
MNSRRALWRIGIRTSVEAEEAVAELLRRVSGAENVSSYSDMETGVLEISIYLPARPKWGHIKRELLAGLERVKLCGLDPRPAKVRLEKLRHIDWANAWKRHFRPLTIGSKLLLKPSWSRKQPAKGQTVVVLDPGLSFGTGHHPTTFFCLSELARYRGSGPQAFLDIGTGSGILAISAAKLGYAPVKAFDFDVDAVRAAKSNARSNEVSRNIQIEHCDLRALPTRPSRRFAVVCANLISDLLVEQRRKILGFIEPQGLLILAGILTTEFPLVKRAFQDDGLSLVRSKTECEWTSASFARASTRRTKRPRSASRTPVHSPGKVRNRRV